MDTRKARENTRAFLASWAVKGYLIEGLLMEEARGTTATHRKLLLHVCILRPSVVSNFVNPTTTLGTWILPTGPTLVADRYQPSQCDCNIRHRRLSAIVAESIWLEFEESSLKLMLESSSVRAEHAPV
ncbi:hypothetical protein EVAR_856_1 [Eumeta japonica]|uniref:Uncharacterized protein n=1 Tax=Eumeta variegata TaxID=151549 RepID=A0A4C1SDT0_EUMVA|nr:hypothetical protein EVAR_856_1 [Eumeta japonica]